MSATPSKQPTTIQPTILQTKIGKVNTRRALTTPLQRKIDRHRAERFRGPVSDSCMGEYIAQLLCEEFAAA